MKKTGALILALVMLAGPVLSAAEETAAPLEMTVLETRPEETELPEDFPEELIVGHTTVTKGDFFTEMFGNDTSDIDVRAMIHGYNLVNWDQEQGVYVIDESVVENLLVADNEEGDKTYYFGLCDDLYFSDGTPITAWDYAFSLLLMMSPEIEQIGGKIYRAEHIKGYREYISGEVPYLDGVAVLDDHQLAITLDHEFLPYFFEVGLLLCVPYPIKEIAPGCRVYAGQKWDLGDGYGYGVRIGNADESVQEPVYTAELLRKTIMDPETGYNSHPKVVSGPYRLVEYENGEAHFELNEYFKGVWDGAGVSGSAAAHKVEYTRMNAGGGTKKVTVIKPTIPKVRLELIQNEEAKDLFEAGELHLFNKATYEPVINELLGQSSLKRSSYARIGLAFLTFTYDWPTVHDMEVRQAIAWCMDREQMTRDYCGAYGMVVNGYYGIEQWEYLICSGQFYPLRMLEDGETPGTKGFANLYAATDEEFDEMTKAWDDLSLDSLTNYTVNTDRAKELLEKAGWVLNKDGEPFREGVNAVRCKRIDDELVSLELKMMYPEGNRMVDTLEENMIRNLNEVGITLELVPAPMEKLLASYYREAERTTDMIYMGTNFHSVVDPSITYSADATPAHGIWNNTFSDDEELYGRAVDMRRTEPGDIYGYMEKWIRFQQRYNEVLPTIPVYSNIYFDFYVPELQNYNITAHVTWSQAIVESLFRPLPEEAELPEEENPEEPEEDPDEIELE